ncbi:unnamed protein product [Cyberlindnera jadinii]|uniref:Gaa1-domain-containing protein n=1 Tax=Cyberlindnera jadinii (strain ATCC 18201 / CBS 1600 / BCRC 20928 / JCM 3617 / NBRC 0987 / NRRL Y-1542) TaxID=983966 RepID=A0A0H5C1J5_CYBJN|nr:unnamed protein product [Cyberlindnera jadinii]
MALLQSVYHQIVKHQLIRRTIRFLPLLSLALAIGGVGWLFVLPMDGQYRNNYISENALMPSQAYSYFRESEWNILRGFRTQINGFDVDDVDGNLQSMRLWLEDIGYKTAIHECADGKKNLYAIFHSPRGDDTEAIVLGAAYESSDGALNVGGLSLSLALARYFRRWIVWSKNIIIVIPQDPNESLREWVNAYHSNLDLTGGTIEAAIMMDYPSNTDNFEYVELYYEGLNGQLPNLDLVNTAVWVTEHEGPRVSIQGTKQQDLYTNDYWSRLRILTHGIISLATAGVRKGHGNEAFSGYRIQAITLKAIGRTGPYDITVFGRIPEAVFRSVNNLLEKFHQSFFFYLLLAPRHFVSFGTYLPSSGALVISYILASLHKVFNSQFEVSYLLGFAIQSSLIFATTVVIGFFISLLAPLLPIVISYGLIAAFALVSFTPLLVRVEGKKELVPLLRSTAILFFSTVMSSLQVLNFSLTFSMGLFALPLTFVNDSFPQWLNCLCLLVSNPFVLAIPLSTDFDGGLQELLHGLLTGWKVFHSQTWIVVSIGWLPTWLTVLYSVLLKDSSRSTEDPKKAE